MERAVLDGYTVAFLSALPNTDAEGVIVPAKSPSIFERAGGFTMTRNAEGYFI